MPSTDPPEPVAALAQELADVGAQAGAYVNVDDLWMVEIPLGETAAVRADFWNDPDGPTWVVSYIGWAGRHGVDTDEEIARPQSVEEAASVIRYQLAAGPR